MAPLRFRKRAQKLAARQCGLRLRTDMPARLAAGIGA